MIPSCDQTGTPRHFHSSSTCGSACLMSLRICASVLPRQSGSSLILASMSFEGEAAPFALVGTGLVFFVGLVELFMEDLAVARSDQSSLPLPLPFPPAR